MEIPDQLKLSTKSAFRIQFLTNQILDYNAILSSLQLLLMGAPWVAL